MLHERIMQIILQQLVDFTILRGGACRSVPEGENPTRSVIHGHPVQHSVAFKYADKLLLHGHPLFIGAVSQTQIKTGMVIPPRVNG